MTQTVQLPIAVDTDLYVGGKHVSASDAGRFDVLDPSTGQPLASIADGTVEDALAAVAAAHEAGPRWAAVPPRERAEILRAAFDAMNAKAEGARRTDLAGKRQGAARRARRSRLRRRVFPLVLGGGGAQPRFGDHIAVGVQPDRRAAPAGRSVRAGHAVELPSGDGDPQDRARAGGGVHHRAQARQRQPR